MVVLKLMESKFDVVVIDAHAISGYVRAEHPVHSASRDKVAQFAFSDLFSGMDPKAIEKF